MTKSFTLLALILVTLSLQQTAHAICKGDPVKEKDEDVRCKNLKEKADCRSVLGCEWTSEPAQILICNKTDKKISVVTQEVRPNHDRIVDTGWFNLEVGRCGEFEAANATSFSYFAQSYKGHFYWYGNGQSMCYDASGKAFENYRSLSELSCGGVLTEIQAYQTIPVKEDDKITLNVEGTGVDLSPAPPVFEPTYASLALGYCKGTSEYFYSYGESQEESRAMMMGNCGRLCNSCELALLTEFGKPTCVAVLKGAEPFLAWNSSNLGKEAAVNGALQECQKQGQSCLIATVFCNDEVVTK